MNIGLREHHYQMWQHDLQAGTMDKAAFLAAVDSLAFVDGRGRQWMIGAQSGRWYVHNGRGWQPADPDPAGPPEPPAPEPPARIEPVPAAVPEPFDIVDYVPREELLPAKALLALGAALVVVLALVVWPVGSAPPAGHPAAAPSPRPPLGGDSGGGGGDGNGDSNGGTSGRGGLSGIFGTVVDMSTDRPGAAIDVSVNGQVVRTDSTGRYSITGLPPGQYIVQPELRGLGYYSNQGAIFVNLDGRSSVEINLTYQSRPGPPATDTPQAIAVAAIGGKPPQAIPAALPPALPASGGSRAHQPWVLMGVGLLMFIFGALLYTTRPAGPA